MYIVCGLLYFKTSHYYFKYFILVTSFDIINNIVLSVPHK